MDVNQDLRATSDELLRDLEALSALEDEKRTLPLDDPRLVEIAEQVQAVASRVLAGSVRQASLTRRAGDAPGDGSSIDAVHRPLAQILADWREVERRAADVPAGSAEAAEIQILADRLRQEYADAYERAKGSG